MSININLGLTNFVDNALKNSPEFEPKRMEQIIPFGVSFLDRTMLGISPQDLVLIGAPPGIGKTELAASIAINAAYNKKRVVCFALEADPGEWEQRAKYKLYVAALGYDKGPEAVAGMNYMDFDAGLYAEKLAPYRELVEKQIAAIPSMQMYYRERNFGVKDFERIFTAINDKADLVVIDHLHYFDTTDENENRAVGEIMKKIRDMNQLTGIPVVLVGHLRKRDKANGALIPSLEDFHGTSEIGKIATKMITLAPGEPVANKEGQFYTYFRIPKCRKGNFVTKFVARGVFNIATNEYEKDFVLGRLSQDERTFIPFKDYAQLPTWYRDRLARERRGN